MDNESIIVTIEDRICWITLNRPNKLNSLTMEMHKKIQSTLFGLGKNVKCVILQGSEGRAFSAGADITELEKLSPQEIIEYSQTGQKTILTILEYSKPVVAVVQGYALGGGLELAMACDFRLATEKSRFGLPEIRLGLIPGWGGVNLLNCLIGLSKAKELLITGEYLDSAEALKIGMINKIISDENLKDDVLKFVTPILAGPSQSMSALKRLLLDTKLVNTKLREESISFGELFDTEDAREGIIAFKEKRKPEFL